MIIIIIFYLILQNIFSSMNKLIFFVIAITFFAFSCSEYEKLLKSDDIQLKYEKAFEYFEEEEYVKSSTLLQYLIPIYKGTDKAAKVEFYYAKSLYFQRDYLLAAYHFNEFSKNYGISEYAEEADFLGAYCYYLMSPRPSLDQEYTLQAISAFNLFIIKYPNSSKKAECYELINEMNNKLVEKSYLSAKLYYDLGYYKASIVALNNSLADYPDSDFREELKYLLLKSNFLLAQNSIQSKMKQRYQDTVDEYYSFIDEFPESKHVKEAERIYEESIEILEN